MFGVVDSLASALIFSCVACSTTSIKINFPLGSFGVSTQVGSQLVLALIYL